MGVHGSHILPGDSCAMRTWTAAVVVAWLAAVALCRPDNAAAAAGTYTDKYDRANVEEILSNERAYKMYMDCMLDRGPCPAPGKQLRDHLLDAVRTLCKKCTEHQRKKMKETFLYLEKNKPEDLKLLLDHYDSDKKYRDELFKFIKSSD